MPGASTEEKGFAREPARARAVYFRSKFRLLQTNIGSSLDGARQEYDFQSTTFSGQLRVLSAAVWPRVSSYSYNPLQ